VSLMRKQIGLTLIELMIAMVIGLLLVAAVITLYVSMAGSNVDHLKSIRLNHELRSTLALMARDIRRAGHNQDAATESTAATSINPFSTAASTALTTSVSNSCSGSAMDSQILFSYDADDDANTDFFGYRFDTSSGTVDACAVDTSTATCSSSDWEALTDEDLIEITCVSFDLDLVDVASGAIFGRQVTVSLTGQLRSDTDFTKTIGEVVKIRNDHSSSW
jgi:prepilin peptidase dependent protein B